MELEFFIKPDEVVEAICGVASVEALRHRQTRTRTSPDSTLTNLNRTGAGKRGTNTGSRSGSRFTKASACRARRWRNIGRSRRNWRITPAPAWTFCSSSRSARRSELEGIAARSDFDLSQHARFSGKPMGVFDEELRAAWGKLPKEKAGRTLAPLLREPEKISDQDGRSRRKRRSRFRSRQPKTRTVWRKGNTSRTSSNRARAWTV